jgi:hypothetical protein
MSIGKSAMHAVTAMRYLCKRLHACAGVLALILFMEAMPNSLSAATSPLLRVAQISEYNVKAGYLLLFTRYVEWPDSAFSDKATPLTIAVLGDDPFGRVLDETIRDQVSHGRPVRVVRANDVEKLPTSHVVYIAKTNREQEQTWLRALRNRPVLTVAESDTALEAGSVVRFVVEQSTVRFIVNRQSARQVNLDIRTPMLQAARAIHDAPLDDSSAGTTRP